VLTYAEKILPIPWIHLASVSMIDDDGDLSWQGSGWPGLVVSLEEMQGDSPDIYYALVPDGPSAVRHGKRTSERKRGMAVPCCA
jgi:hypothetical protein